LSEKTAILADKGNKLANLKSKLDRLGTRCLEKVREVVGDARSRDANMNVDEKSPEGLLAYLDNLLEEHDGDAPTKIDAETLKQLKKKFRKMVRALPFSCCQG